MPGLQRIEKVSHVILMVGLIGLADLGHAARPQMVLICGLREIFEWLVMRNVVSYRRREVVPSQACMVSAAHRAIIKARPRIVYDRTGREPVENIPMRARRSTVRS